MRILGLAAMLLALGVAPALAQQKSGRADLGDALSNWIRGDDKGGEAVGGSTGGSSSFSGLINSLIGGKKERATAAGLEGIARADDANVLEITKPDGSMVKVRQWGLEAPETKQWPWGPRARGELDRLLAASGGKVSCSSDGIMTKSGILVARCFAGTADISAKLIEGGYGVEWREVSGGAYTAAEANARSQKRGVWSGQ